jgi:hypothetical protein
MGKVKLVIYLLFLISSMFGQDSTRVKIVDKESKPRAVLQVKGVVDTTKVLVDSSAVMFDTVNYDNPSEDLELYKTIINGQSYTVMITENGDTLILADIEDISITSLRAFENDEDYLKYLKFKRYAAKVYPYAKEAIKIFRELEYATQNMKKRQRKKYIKELEKELEVKFEEPLSKLTKLQGKILIKMIERELDETMYNLLKSLKGRISAFTWHNMGKLYSYDLKEGYHEGTYKILDAVLQDFNVSYEIEAEEKLRIRNELLEKMNK